MKWLNIHKQRSSKDTDLFLAVDVIYVNTLFVCNNYLLNIYSAHYSTADDPVLN